MKAKQSERLAKQKLMELAMSPNLHAVSDTLKLVEGEDTDYRTFQDSVPLEEASEV